MRWEINPEGLHNMLVRLVSEDVGDLPMVVTENGMAWDDTVRDGEVADIVRRNYVAAHLNAAREAIAAGANVQGFFYWSLLDNHEWAFGYAKRFGLVHVDFEKMKRTPNNLITP